MRIIFIILATVIRIWLLTTGDTRSLVILYTHNTNGILENCGCPGNPMGGVDKRLTVMQRISVANPGRVLRVDAGDMLSSMGFEEKDQFIVRAYAQMEYDAIGVGDQEFSNGPEFFDRMKEKGLPLISATLISAATGKQLLPEYEIKTVNGIRIGITSVVSKEPFLLLPERRIRGLQFADPVSALNNVLHRIRDSCDIIVLLSHLGYTRDLGIAKEFPDIDVIVGAHSQVRLTEPERFGNTLIVQAGRNAEFVGELHLNYDEENSTITGARVTLHPLLKDVPGDRRVTDIVAEYLRLASSSFRDTCIYSSPVPSQFAMLDNTACMNCHEEYVYKWQLTKHAMAFATLVHQGHSSDPDCAPCHTTGFCRPEGFKLRGNTPQFRNVGCVECHFVSADHIQHPEGTAEAVQRSRSRVPDRSAPAKAIRALRWPA